MQILASVLIAIIPHVTDWIIVTFASLPLVTGIAHIAAGYVQTRLNTIAYYQQSIIVWMAAMSFGSDGFMEELTKHSLFSLLYMLVPYSASHYMQTRLWKPTQTIRLSLSNASSIRTARGSSILSSENLQ